jgi:Uma2 family endonuclease
MTTLQVTDRRRLAAGTTGWTASDLDDPYIEGRWDRRRYEIVEGVLTRMPTAHYDSSVALYKLIKVVAPVVERHDAGAVFPTEVDVIVGERRVPKVDALSLSPRDRELQRQANALHGRGTRKQLRYGRILVPPTLIIESLSRGHEDHDRLTKRQWFGEMKVPNYWLLNYFEQSLECLVLDGDDYRVDLVGRGDQDVRPSLFPGLVIPLGKLWAD